MDPFYVYFEERAIGQATGHRRKNADGLLPKTITDIRHLIASQYPWWKTREFEHRETTPESEGVWPINQSRVEHFLGDPGILVCPYHSRASQWPPDIADRARQLRLHHYVRVWSPDECLDCVRKGQEVRVALEVTEEWHNPPNGIIELPDQASPILGSHAVPVTDFKDGLFRFQNSWGANWGDNGWGAFTSELFDRYVIEAWLLLGKGIRPPVQSETGLVTLLWKSAFGFKEVHGREIVDAATGDRLAWAFAVRRGQFLDLEEFFVWPAFRRQRLGTQLANLIAELVRDSNTTLRAWVSVADCEPENRPALIAAMKLLKLNLHPSQTRMAGFVGLEALSPDQLQEPRFPFRPAVIRDALDPAVGTRLFTVWYGTNRKPIDSNDGNKGFTAERDTAVHLGKCKVAVPNAHRFGSIGSGWLKRWLRWSDDRLTVTEVIAESEQDFATDIRTCLSSYLADECHSLVFLHGFNVTFEEAAVRAAQIGFDLQIPGVTAFFSWPSQGGIANYLADEATIEASEPAILEFMNQFASITKPHRIHLIAHSMGNRGLIKALERIARDIANHSHVRFGQIILAAPDLDVDVFKNLAALYPKFSERTTLYASHKDRAVSTSTWLHKFPRVGFIPPVTVVSGIDTIEVPKFNVLDLLGHSYFADAEPLLYDISDLIRRGVGPAQRIRLDECKTENNETYWKMQM